MGVYFPAMSPNTLLLSLISLRVFFVGDFLLILELSVSKLASDLDGDLLLNDFLDFYLNPKSGSSRLS